MEVASTSREDVPANPGVLPPSTTPRTTPPNLNEGAQWLMTNQRTDGGWMDLSQTMERDTAEAVLTFKAFPAALTNVQAGLLWLVIIAVLNTGISAYYYLKIVKVMWAGAPASEEKLAPASWALGAALSVSCLGTFVLGVIPDPLVKFAQAAIQIITR